MIKKTKLNEIINEKTVASTVRSKPELNESKVPVLYCILKLMMEHKTRSFMNSYHYKIEDILEKEFLFDAKVRLSIVLQRGNHIANTLGLRLINSTFDTRQQVNQHLLHN